MIAKAKLQSLSSDHESEQDSIPSNRNDLQVTREGESSSSLDDRPARDDLPVTRGAKISKRRRKSTRVEPTSPEISPLEDVDGSPPRTPSSPR